MKTYESKEHLIESIKEESWLFIQELTALVRRYNYKIVFAVATETAMVPGFTRPSASGFGGIELWKTNSIEGQALAQAMKQVSDEIVPIFLQLWITEIPETNNTETFRVEQPTDAPRKGRSKMN